MWKLWKLKGMSGKQEGIPSTPPNSPREATETVRRGARRLLNITMTEQGQHIKFSLPLERIGNALQPYMEGPWNPVFVVEHVGRYLHEYAYGTGKYKGIVGLAQLRLLQSMTRDDIVACVQSLRLYGALQTSALSHWFARRRLYDIAGRGPRDDDNVYMLGCDSHYLESEEALNQGVLQPTRAAGSYLEVPFLVDEETASIGVCTVSGVQLDDRDNVWWSTFVQDGEVKEKPFRAYIRAAMDIYARCSEDHPERSLCVLSAFGMKSFLEALPEHARKRPRRIIAAEMCELIATLRAQEKEVCFTAGDGNDPNWKLINKLLKAESTGQDAVPFAGAVPGKWMLQPGILLLNPGDQKTLLGNKCNLDTSGEGFNSRNSAMNFVHFLIAVALIGSFGNLE